MSFQYIQDTYNVPARRGQRVKNLSTGKLGTITSCRGQYINIRWDLDKKAMGPYHPTDELEYIGPRKKKWGKGDDAQPTTGNINLHDHSPDIQ
jgi:hypothetical protein